MGSEAERNITSVFWAEIYGVFSMHFDTQRSWRQSVFSQRKKDVANARGAGAMFVLI